MKTLIPLIKPYIPPKNILMPAIEEILYSGYIAEGKEVYEFEDMFKAYIGNKYCLAVHSGTDALHLALKLAGVKPDDEVISTPLTAEPTNTTIAMMGAKVIWADIDINNGLIDPDSVVKLITSKTKAIVVVHYAGMVCDMNRLNKISKDYNIPIIEDSAHAMGAKYKGKYIGTNSPYTIFSLQAIKQMTTIDGGFLCVKNEEDYTNGRLMRWFGLDKTKSRLDNDIKTVGYKYAMNNVNATVGKIQMHFLDKVLDKYISNGKYYDKELCGIKGIELVKYSDDTEPSYWLYTMKVERRDSFIKMLESNGVIASPLHHRNDTHSIFADSKRLLPNMDKFYNSFVHIPCGWWVNETDRKFIVDCIKSGW
ncbi:DegT/DnrJ/EryC1/StrS family aminotransferase [Marinilabiliaceae bacterium JC040]|nr:DegT/DnrJ/EryC1/StrS family aminotransferase [Marinilabiliaceae bacterium JC040]